MNGIFGLVYSITLLEVSKKSKVSDYASSEFWLLSSEKRPIGWLESKVESGKLKARTNADLEFE
jgi:hypothetical protein